MGRSVETFGICTRVVYLGLALALMSGVACSNGRGGGGGEPAQPPVKSGDESKTPGTSAPQAQPAEAPKTQPGENPKPQESEPPKPPVTGPANGSPGGSPSGPGPIAAPPARPSEPPQDPDADVAIAPMPNRLKFAPGVISERKAALEEAISTLYALPLKSDDPELRKLLKVQTVAPADLQNWLEERVQFVVDEEFSLASTVFDTGRAHAYQNSNVLPVAEQGLGQTDRSTVMSNLGAAVYYAGKKYKRLLGVRLGGDVGDVVLTSPRVGLLKIGAGLFPELSPGFTRQNLWLDIYRAATLFHEARHSDGRGKTLSFMHAKCPEGSDFEGVAACDFASNGPYTVGAAIQKKLMMNCDRCSERSKMVLKTIYLDFAGRVLRGKVKIKTHNPPVFVAKPVDWDDAPEGAR